MSCARVKQCSAASIGATERHNERLNTDYANVNVVQERIPLKVHYRSPPSSYMDTLRTMEAAGTVSTRGLRKDATLFDEIIIDVNTMYFERNGGYEYAKKFYEEAYHFLEKKFGSEYVVAAVMHADEINKAATSDLGKDVYHYHLHAVVIPVVDKDILWSKRCKDPALRGTVRETIHQVSPSKKWASNIPLKDEQGQPSCGAMESPSIAPRTVSCRTNWWLICRSMASRISSAESWEAHARTLLPCNIRLKKIRNGLPTFKSV